MIVKVLIKPMEQSLTDENSAMDSFRRLTGKAASVCYAEKCDINSLNMTQDEAESLCDKVISRGHTSVAEHYNVTLAFQGISKLLAMMLNSFQVYSTSERSGRYTLMTGNTQKEVALYSKWLSIFRKVIQENSPKINNNTLETRARENARYVLSVLTHDTSMVYTTNVRQWNAVCNTLTRYAHFIENNLAEDEFYVSVKEDIEDLVHNIKNCVGYDKFLDDSIFCQDMFCMFSNIHMMRESVDDEDTECFSTSYTTEYLASYAQLAHIHRHRAIKYFVLSRLKTGNYYIPQILRGTELEAEWLQDLSSVADLVPQATLLTVRETGYIGDFFHKCDERICARVMLETMEQTVRTLKKFRAKATKLPAYAKIALNGRFRSDGEPRLKCEVRGVCHEPCDKLGISGTPLDRKV